MKVLTIEVKSCNDCPFLKYHPITYYRYAHYTCEKVKLTVEQEKLYSDKNPFPSFCPLPDKPL